MKRGVTLFIVNCMLRSATFLFVTLWVVMLTLASRTAYGLPAPSEKSPERPDVSAMTPAEAEAALAKYAVARNAWMNEIEERVRPMREAAMKAGMEKAEAQRAAALSGVTAKLIPKWVVNPGEGYDWQVDARAHRIPEAGIELLRRDGIVISGPDFEQSFSVYSDSSLAPFVTTDSLLNGFHVLLEASLRKFELRRAQRLRAVLEGTWANLDVQLRAKRVDPAMVRPYAHHLALVLGPALRLLGSHVRTGDSAAEQEIEATIKLITDAKEVALPNWLAPSSSDLVAIDFRRCRPLGFYADNPTLADYYRAIRWLQMVPFRASRDDEAGAVALLSEMEYANRADGLKQFVEDGALVWGRGEDPTFLAFAAGMPDFLDSIARDGDAKPAVKAARDRTRQLGGKRPRVNDRLQMPVSDAGSEDGAVRVLAPAVLPDAVFLAEIAEKRPISQRLPNGLEIAAWLGSPFASAQLRLTGAGAVADYVEKQKEQLQEAATWYDSVPAFYYDVLRSLFAEPDPAVPPFMKTEAWQRKSLQTALSGWVQLRHSWELQAKLNVTFMSRATRPAGFVEPNPDFFRRLYRLANVTVARLQEAGVFGESAADEAEFFRHAVKAIDRLGLGKVAVNIDDLDPLEGGELIFDLEWIAAQIDDRRLAHQGDDAAPIDPRKMERGEQIAHWKRIRSILQARVDALEKGERVRPVVSLLMRRDPDRALFGRWQLLLEMSGRFEAMVQKELRGADWNADDAEFLTEYKERLGELMGYVSSATLMPKDDAPRWTTVYHDVSSDRQIAVAIGRPRALYVLYPWKGTMVLCRGAVMPYYEYSAERRLTDAEWRAVLDGDDAPQQPSWIEPLAPAVLRVAE